MKGGPYFRFIKIMQIEKRVRNIVLLLVTILSVILPGCRSSSGTVPYATGEQIRRWDLSLDEWRVDHPEYDRYVLRPGYGGPARSETKALQEATADAAGQFRKAGVTEVPELLFEDTLQKQDDGRFFWEARVIVGIDPLRGNQPPWIDGRTDTSMLTGIGVGLDPDEARRSAERSITEQLAGSEETPPYRETDLFRGDDGLYWIRLEIGTAELERELALLRARVLDIADGPRTPLTQVQRQIGSVHAEFDGSPWKSVATVVYEGEEVLIDTLVDHLAVSVIDDIELRAVPGRIQLEPRSESSATVAVFSGGKPLRESLRLELSDGRTLSTGTDGTAVISLPGPSTVVGDQTLTVKLAVPYLPDGFTPPQTSLDVYREPPRVQHRFRITSDGTESSQIELGLSMLASELLRNTVRFVSGEVTYDFVLDTELSVVDEETQEQAVFVDAVLSVVLRDVSGHELLRIDKTARDGGLDDRQARERTFGVLIEEAADDPAVSRQLRDAVLEN
jgi:hypothetical protein